MKKLTMITAIVGSMTFAAPSHAFIFGMVKKAEWHKKICEPNGMTTRACRLSYERHCRQIPHSPVC